MWQDVVVVCMISFTYTLFSEKNLAKYKYKHVDKYKRFRKNNCIVQLDYDIDMDCQIAHW